MAGALYSTILPSLREGLNIPATLAPKFRQRDLSRLGRQEYKSEGGLLLAILLLGSHHVTR